MGRFFAIGDIHGERELLRTLLDQIEPIAEPADTIIFLGDYVDRGPDSRGVIDEILSLRKRFIGSVICLKGNHEQQMLHCLKEPSTFWLDDMEGWATVDSYLPGSTELHCRELAEGKPIALELCQTMSRFALTLPDDHRNFLDELVRSHRADSFIFAHGGINVNRSFQDQTDDDCVWTDGRRLRQNWRGPETLVVGHKPTHKVAEEFRGQPILDEHFIMVDTGSGRTGVLSAVSLPDRTVYQARR